MRLKYKEHKIREDVKGRQTYMSLSLNKTHLPIFIPHLYFYIYLIFLMFPDNSALTIGLLCLFHTMGSLFNI